MSQQDLPPEPGLTEFERALGALSPMPARLDRDRLIFLAGQAASRRSKAGRWVWPAVAASLAVVALGEAALLANRPEPRVIERLVVVHDPAPRPAPTLDPPTRPATASSEAPRSEELAPVTILVRSPRRDRRRPSEPPQTMSTSTAPLHLQVGRYGLGALPEPPPLPLALHSAGDAPAPDARMLRSEIQHLLNPGESS